MGALRSNVNWKSRGWEEKLDKWWNKDGLSATQIGMRLGVSRGSVLGKVHRMGWSGAGPGGGLGGKDGLTQRMRFRPKNLREFKRVGIKLKRATNARQQERLTTWRTADTAELTTGCCATKIRELPGDPPAHERKTFSENTGCMWPFEDGTFCARKREGVLHSYCSEHRKRSINGKIKPQETPSW